VEIKKEILSKITRPHPTTELTKPEVMTVAEEIRIAAINKELFSVYQNKVDIDTRHNVLYKYVRAKQFVAQRTGRFGIVNNRIFITPKQMFIPYLLGDTLLVHKVKEGKTTTVLTLPIAHGTILTDKLLNRLAGVRGDPIELESDLFDFDASRAIPVHFRRIQDMVDHLAHINKSANRNEALYVLRILVARLSLFSFKKYLNTKNLQSEVHNLFKELVRFTNMPLSERLLFLVRILIRDIAAVVTKPKLIDQIWNDTIDLSEIHIRGSKIVNELRRSTHHAMGKHTLKLAKAYMKYLDTGETDELALVGYPGPALADEEARNVEHSKRAVKRIAENLQQLMGISETTARIHNWQLDYKSSLVRCEFGKSLSDELEAAVEGMQDGNRWMYYHHLRIIKGRILDFVSRLPSAKGSVEKLESFLKLKPDEDSFDRENTEEELRSCVNKFIQDIGHTFQDDMFNELKNLLAAYDRNEFYLTFERICRQRESLHDALGERAFPEQRLLLFKLDCLLEEMAYLALNQIASEYDEKGVDFLQCLGIIHACVLNLTHDGLHSRQLRDLASMLKNPNMTYHEIRNVVEQIHRNYHHIIQRVTSPFEKLRQKIKFNEDELRDALANIQRCMHDLNSIAHFTDIARTYIEEEVEDQTSTVGVGSASPPDPFYVIHLSQREKIKQRVESDNSTLNLRNLYGGKGSGLIYISYLNLPTKDGFILPASFPLSSAYKHKKNGKTYDEVIKHLRILESDISKQTGLFKRFGDPDHPLLLAIRGGSVFSMPGMLSTVLFVGMNDEIVNSLAKKNPWCAYDSYRRFLSSFGQTVWGIDMESYNIVEKIKQRYKVKYKYDLPWEKMKEIADATKNILQKKGYGKALEDMLRDPIKQLFTALRAVFDSWNSKAACRYREIKGICNSWQTAAIVQEMAMGNHKSDDISAGMDETQASLTGVIPRSYITELGIRTLTGDFKFSAAGDDLVGGLTKSISFKPIEELESLMPMLARRLRHSVAKLRRFMGTDQEIEFTVEHGVLSILQARAAEIGKNRRITAFKDPGKEATQGIGIRGGAFRGIVTFDKEGLEKLRNEDLSERDDVDGLILVLESPAPEHIPLILSADALLASKGGSTSHAAIAVNGIEKRDYNAVMGATGLQVDSDKREAVIVGKDSLIRYKIHNRDVISIHGTMGSVYIGTRLVKSDFPSNT